MSVHKDSKVFQKCQPQLVWHKLLADDPTKYQMGTVGATSKITAEHCSTKLEHPIKELLEAKYYRDKSW